MNQNREDPQGELVRIEDRDSVRHIVLNRPDKRNAMNEDLVTQLAAAIARAAYEDSVRCVVIRGEGPMFSSGIDLTGLPTLAGDPSIVASVRQPLVEAWNLIETMKKPTICQIHGGCLGMAMEFAVACDFRTMAEDAVMAIPEVKLGLIPDVGGCSRLPALVGLGRAKELIMTGRFVGAQEAHQIGLVNRVAPAGELDQATQGLVDELLACGPLAIGLAKEVLDVAAKPALARTLDLEGRHQERLARSEDFANAASALLEKREPSFAGR